MSECPVFHISGTPPCATMSSASACEHLTSKMIGAPGTRVSTSRANSASNWSPHTMRPDAVDRADRGRRRRRTRCRARRRSRFTLRCRSTSSAGTVGSGRWFEEAAVQLGEQRDRRCGPSLSNTWRHDRLPAQPLPQSITHAQPPSGSRASISIARYASSTGLVGPRAAGASVASSPASIALRMREDLGAVQRQLPLRSS